LERIRYRETVAALTVRRSGGDGEADRRSAWREWIRESSWEELGRRLGMPDLVQLSVTQRSPSGRIIGLAAVGSSGDRKEWTGFDVRRALGLPETLFEMHVRVDTEDQKVVRFLGRGWGHGVGLCQNGSYGLARAGQTYDQILAHYYTGIQIVRWRHGGDDLQSER
jgi:stage II sporulation protein D